MGAAFALKRAIFGRVLSGARVLLSNPLLAAKQARPTEPTQQQQRGGGERHRPDAVSIAGDPISLPVTDLKAPFTPTARLAVVPLMPAKHTSASRRGVYVMGRLVTRISYHHRHKAG